MNFYVDLETRAELGDREAQRLLREHRHYVAYLNFFHSDSFRGRVFYAKHLKRADRAFHPFTHFPTH